MKEEIILKKILKQRQKLDAELRTFDDLFFSILEMDNDTLKCLAQDKVRDVVDRGSMVRERVRVLISKEVDYINLVSTGQIKNERTIR